MPLQRHARRAGFRLALLAGMAGLGATPIWAGDAGPAPDAAGEAERVGPCATRRVVDGDTIDVQCGDALERVRLLRIDTPERGEAGYREASAALRELIGSGDVFLVFETPGRPTRGRYGRLLAYVFAGERNVNLEMVRAGWTTFWTRYGRGRLAPSFTSAELEAQQARRGLWANPGD